MRSLLVASCLYLAGELWEDDSGVVAQPILWGRSSIWRVGLRLLLLTSGGVMACCSCWFRSSVASFRRRLGEVSWGVSVLSMVASMVSLSWCLC